MSPEQMVIDFRNPSNWGFASVSHAATHDERLDAEALGVYSYLCSRGQVGLTLEQAVARFDADVFDRAYRQLLALGYLMRNHDGLELHERAFDRGVIL